MGIYSVDNKVYGINISYYDEINDKYYNMYNYKKNEELNIDDKQIIKKELKELLDNKLSTVKYDYTFLYKCFSTLDTENNELFFSSFPVNEKYVLEYFF
jgi:hypothetical protein